MERREQYDPEDIENLLQERGFDDLLEEERAYVLRHLSGRDEYEKMRALLLHVREDDRTLPPIEADDRVRADVMQAFRAQQHPQWRVWLNTLGGLFQPGDGYAMWRPALALGMLLVLFGVGIYLVRGPLSGPDQQELAEVRRQKAEEPIPAPRSANTDTIQIDPDEPGSGTATAAIKAPVSKEITPEKASDLNGSMEIEEVKTLQREEFETEPIIEDVPVSESLVSHENSAFGETNDPAAAPTSTHVVTQDEFARNQSLANASGTVRAGSTKDAAVKSAKYAEAERSTARSSNMSRPVSEDPQILDLLSAGW